MKWFSNLISCLFHPLLMVTYGVVMALTLTFLAIYPLPLKLAIAAGTFICTAVIPGLFIYLLIRNGECFAEKICDTFEEATDQSVEALEKQLVKFKEKIRAK